METITVDFDIPGLEISNDNRWELPWVVDKVLQGSGRWVGCRYTKDTIAIHAVVDDQEQARSLIRAAIEGHPVFSHLYESVFVKSNNTA